MRNYGYPHHQKTPYQDFWFVFSIILRIQHFISILFLRYKKFQGEWDDFAAEEQAFKKFKKGKLSKDVYEDALLAESAPDEHDIEVAAKKGNQLSSTQPSFPSIIHLFPY